MREPTDSPTRLRMAKKGGMVRKQMMIDKTYKMIR